MQREIVLEQTAIDASGIPQYEARKQINWISNFGEILAYCIFFFAISGA